MYDSGTGREHPMLMQALTTGQRPEDIALRFMRASPPTDLLGLAAALGIRLEYDENLGETAGMIERVTGEASGPFYRITLNSKHSPNRQRFTLAHELAHYMKHRQQIEAGRIVDNALYRSLLPDPMEWEANRYAAQLLMPLSAMQKLWKAGMQTAEVIAPQLGVSVQAAEIRLGQLRGTLALG